MTLFDLWRLIGHYKRVFIILPLAFAIVGIGVGLVLNAGSAYSANSYIVVANGAQITTLTGTAASAAREYEAVNPSYSASAKADAASLTVIITAKGPDSDGVASAANEIASAAVEGAEGLLGQGGINARVEQAYGGTRTSSSSILIYVLTALFAGFAVALCVVAGIDAIQRPVKGSSDMADSSGFAVLGEVPGDTGERLLASVRFASGKTETQSVLVVPAREGASAALVGMLLDRTTRSESPQDDKIRGQRVHVSACAPLLQGAAAAYEARAVDAVIITALQWGDSRKDVEMTADELRLAGANVVGCVLVKKAKGVKGGRDAGRSRLA